MDPLAGGYSPILIELGTQRELPALPQTNDPRSARAAAEEFEAVFLTQMVNAMFAGIETDELTGGVHGEDIFRSVLDQEFASAMARQGGIGIADDVLKEILKYQEVP